MKLKICPRCDERAYEELRTHSYCICCNYCIDLLDQSKTSDEHLLIPAWANEISKQRTIKEQSDTDTEEEILKEKELFSI